MRKELLLALLFCAVASSCTAEQEQEVNSEPEPDSLTVQLTNDYPGQYSGLSPYGVLVRLEHRVLEALATNDLWMLDISEPGELFQLLEEIEKAKIRYKDSGWPNE